MVVPKNAKNPMVEGSGNMLTSTSGKSAKGLRAGGAGSYGSVPLSEIAAAASKYQNLDYASSTPGGAQMSRFAPLSQIDRGPQGAYPGSAMANAQNQANLRKYAEEGGTGLNIANFGSNDAPRLGLTSSANMTGRPVSANMLSPGTMHVDINGNTAEEGGSGTMYAISGQTLPQYRAAAAKQRERWALRRGNRGGLTEQDASRLDAIRRRVANGQASQQQGLAQAQRLANQRGLSRNSTMKHAIAQMGGSAAKVAESTTPDNSYLTKQPTPQSQTRAAQENVDNFNSSDALKAFGVEPDSDWSAYHNRFETIFSGGGTVEVETLRQVRDQLQREKHLDADYFSGRFSDLFSSGYEYSAGNHIEKLLDANSDEELEGWLQEYRDIRSRYFDESYG